MSKLKYTFIYFILFSPLLIAQSDSLKGLQLIDKFIKEQNYIKAKNELSNQIDILLKKQHYYNLTDYVYYTGKITLQISNKQNAIDAVNDFTTLLNSKTDSLKVLRQLALETGSFYELLGDSQSAADYNHKALEITEKMPDKNGELLGLIKGNLGVFYSRMGNLPKAISFQKQALKDYASYPKTNKEQFYLTYNSLGGLMWYSSKVDSSLFYFKKAKAALKEMPPTPKNKFYRSASLLNNMSILYNVRGNTEKALTSMEQTIFNLNKYIKEETRDRWVQQGKEFLYQAIENYAGMYKDLGDFEKAKTLLHHAYDLKTKYLPENSNEIANGKILLGQIYIALVDYKQALYYLDDGIAHFNSLNTEYNKWKADAHYSRASVYEQLDNYEKALEDYQKSEAYYKVSNYQYFDELYLDFSINASVFYAENKQKDKALEIANNAYNYLLKNKDKKTLLEFEQLVNLSHIYLKLNDYKKSIVYSKKALDFFNSPVFQKENELDKIYVELHKPRAILLNTKAQYLALESKDINSLKLLLNQLNEGVSILEKHKAYINNEINTSVLLSKNNAIFELAKNICFDLYSLSNEDNYLTDILSFHESIIYNKLRSQLNSKSSFVRARISEELFNKEQELQKQLNESLDTDIETFISANSNWSEFVKELKTKHPKYYRLKYATITQSVENVHSKVPDNTTIVRYVFIDDSLYALVLNPKGSNIYPLNTKDLTAQINTLQNETSIFNKETDVILHELYKKLWQPIEQHISTSKVVIIPDKELFNLSFEMLLRNPNSSYHKNYLLHTYSFSYNYSLLLIDKESKTIGYDSGFIAFAPEFNDDMKQSYRVAIKDSLSIDKTYLTLLPQPFAKNLADNTSKLFDGTSFLNENSTEQIFKDNAKEHKIIHIGTHAESNNVSPELSRLIFAKSINQDSINNDNYLYTYEIYNCNLASNLTVLTACETGKPAYQSGEGMISLAHAFNYAGSESILTSLWKIDEQSSSNIISSFYNYLSEGLSKDVALQKAKLDYLETAQGRALAPQYWAGLVLIGDATPINIKIKTPYTTYILIIAVVLILLVFMYRTFRK